MSESLEDETTQLREAALALGEHYDSVQIIVTCYVAGGERGETRQLSYGTGNWYARFGSVMEWVKRGELAMQADADDE